MLGRMVARALIGVGLIVISLLATMVGLGPATGWDGQDDPLQQLAWIGPPGIALGIAITAAAKAPPGRFAARVGAHLLLVVGLVLFALAILATQAHYGGPCLTVIFGPIGLALVAAGVMATRATWRP